MSSALVEVAAFLSPRSIQGVQRADREARHAVVNDVVAEDDSTLDAIQEEYTNFDALDPDESDFVYAAGVP